MNCSLHRITYPTFRPLLLVRLREAIYLQKDVPLWNESESQAKMDFQAFYNQFERRSVVLEQVRNETFVAYASPIALQLASHLHVTPLDLARAITENCHNVQGLSMEWFNLNEELMKLVWNSFNVNVSCSGWITFTVSDRGCASWLQYCLQNSLPPLSLPSPLVAPRDTVLACQYAHARCGALLRLGQQQGLVNLAGSPPNWQVSCPESLPWMTADDRLCFRQPTEWQLFQQMLTILDDLYNSSTIPTGQLVLLAATRLSRDFQQFDRACRIVGQTQADHTAIAQCRLALILLTQRLLHQLLQSLGACAPFEI